MIIIKSLTKNKEKKWDKFVSSNKNGYLLHKSSYITFQKENNRNTKGLMFYKNKELIGLISLNKERLFLFTRYHGQELLIKNKKYKKEIIEILKEKLKGTYIKINNKTNNITNSVTPLTFILDTKNKDISSILKEDISSGAERAIKKAMKNNLKVEITNSKKEITKFYPIYCRKMQEFGSKPNSLKSIINLLKNKGYKLFNIYFKNKVIAGGTMIISKNKITNHLASSKREYLKYSPNNFLYYQMIIFAKKNKLRFVDYGPSLKFDKVAKFKESMGGKSTPFEEHIILNKTNYFILNFLSLFILKIKRII